MTSDLDIYRTANVLVKRYGKDAALEAAQSADAMLEKGSLDGQRAPRLTPPRSPRARRPTYRSGPQTNAA